MRERAGWSSLVICSGVGGFCPILGLARFSVDGKARTLDARTRPSQTGSLGGMNKK